MQSVNIIGAGLTKFGRHLDRNLKSLAAEAVQLALKDADLDQKEIQGAWAGNASQGVLQGQESVRGQVVLREMGIGGIPVINVENACASSATALQGAWAMVALGEIDVALVLGMEKMYFEDRSKVLAAFEGCMDIEALPQIKADFARQEEKLRQDNRQQEPTSKVEPSKRSIFVDDYVSMALKHMKTYGTTQQQIACICSKNHFHSSLNPLAQYQKKFSVKEVLEAPEVVWPLTRPMCSPIGDGAAAVVVVSDAFARRHNIHKMVGISACMLSSGEDAGQNEMSGPLTRLANAAYERAGIGPEDIDLAEVHDGTAFGELYVTEELGFCPIGEGGSWAEAGHSTLGGNLPVNVSGGLESQGHPIGATGVRQVVELYWQLTQAKQVKNRQVENAKVGLAQNAGGTVRGSDAALSVTILKA